MEIRCKSEPIRGRLWPEKRETEKTQKKKKNIFYQNGMDKILSALCNNKKINISKKSN